MKAIFNGTVIADSDRTTVVEGNHYFPSESVAMHLLGSSPTPYSCAWKGRADYFDLTLDGTNVEDAAWSYPDPKPAARAIAGHFAFDQRKGVTITR